MPRLAKTIPELQKEDLARIAIARKRGLAAISRAQKIMEKEYERRMKLIESGKVKL